MVQCTMGVDLVGPMPMGKGDCKFVVVTIEYFMKWEEAEALASITIGDIRNYLWKSIVYHYRYTTRLRHRQQKAVQL